MASTQDLLKQAADLTSSNPKRAEELYKQITGVLNSHLSNLQWIGSQCQQSYEAIRFFRLVIFPALVINARNLLIPSWRIPAGICVSINVDSGRCQKSSHASPALSVEIRASYEFVRMLGARERMIGHYSLPRVIGSSVFTSPGQILRDPVDLSLAVENFRLASRHPTQRFPERITEAIDWARQAEVFQHESALEAYQMCFELFDSHMMTQSSIISRREVAAAFRGARPLPVDAALCAIRRDNIRRAVELVEQGRGQQWSLALRFRTPLEDLKSRNPELARNFLNLSTHLSDALDSIARTDRAVADQAATEYRRLTKQWEAVVAETHLQVAARQSPIIILIASQNSCSAIIVPTSGGPHHVPLPSIALADLKILKDRFARAIRDASRMSPAESRTDLIVLLRIIWDEVVLPVVNALESRQLTKKGVPPSFVAIGQGQPGAGKGKALLAVDSKLELIRKLVPTTAYCITISGDAATRASALSTLQQNAWVHLACHGKQDPTEPNNSRFLMRDEHLTLLNIAEFAFLSACPTAMGDEKMSEEVVHLAAGLQFSGFKSIVGTLWEVDDAIAKHVVEAFYRYMFGDLKDGGVMDCTKAAWVLNCATHAVKTEVPLEQRMVFVHIGV
ncbi:CHAT domain-containing protein [Suillus fuscotomentosus]|uniref:CHAT domain-containing protein n=1 Tax=Suillus fuscotomentosus TaxID=1912939 RepID=A0AAD4DRS1_9AGAM|nr:CHAT domain-containing protein [Suillus fuscotomentosus]XP_041218341.1 CHAT domain-containing protein [Suillus fuscotomentosus]KAG1891856.1 CHAT domain-containing protein [Suillus fuscotomentosus]KAG1891865.1 CHAT domain-containing protein [Suillus fuscotomentosus]